MKLLNFQDNKKEIGMSKSEKNLKVKKELDKIRNQYTNELSQQTLNALIVGRKGIGKTLLATTARTPVLIHSFDPGGTKHLKPEIKAGDVIPVTKYEGEDSNKPSSYKEWEKDFRKWKDRGFFEEIGTLMLDSISTWQKALYNEIVSRGFSSDGVLTMRGWQILGNTIEDMIRMMLDISSDVIVTGHTKRRKDDVSGRMMVGMDAPPSIRSKLPKLFDEYYCMMPDPQDDSERVLLTSSTNRTDASTRIGRGKFDQYEDPNIKYLLKKANLIEE